jgi:predicted secreted protein
VEVISAGSYTKGQFVRLFITSDGISAPSYAIAAARTLSLHVSVSLEDATTKDTTGDWQVQEPTGISYDITSGALMRSGETITSQVGAKSLSDLESIYNSGTPINWQITNVSGDNNRTAGTQIVYGMAVLTQLQLTAQNRSSAEYQATLQGYGNYIVAAA